MVSGLTLFRKTLHWTYSKCNLLSLGRPLTNQQGLKVEVLPHVLAILQTFLLVLDVTSFLNIPFIVTGHGKVITPFQLWIFSFSLLMVFLFYLVRKNSVVEKSLFWFSVLAGLFSSLNLTLFLVDDLLIGMQITAILTIAFYLTVFVISAGKILILLSLSFRRRLRRKTHLS